MCRLSDSYSFEPVPEGVDPALILGGQGNLWTESVPNFRHAQYMTWPRGWALAEVLWSPREVKNWDQFVKKVEQHFIRADYGEIKVARSMYNAIVTPYIDEDAAFKIKLDTEINGLDIYYSFDNTDPDPYSQAYDSPLSVPKDATWLKVITYRNHEAVGKMITLGIDELGKRVRK
jgi:hexosaminidase